MNMSPVIADFTRLAALEAQTARPDSPQRPEPERRRGGALRLVRAGMTSSLRWLADAVDPGPAAPVSPPKPQTSC
jgi:hypothetical protein